MPGGMYIFIQGQVSPCWVICLRGFLSLAYILEEECQSIAARVLTIPGTGM